MARQKEQARSAGKFKMATNLEYTGVATTFKGYETLETTGKITALYKDGTAVNRLSEGDLGVVVLDNTPFYAESGGQIGDNGVLKSDNGIFAVEDTQKIQASVSVSYTPLDVYKRQLLYRMKNRVIVKVGPYVQSQNTPLAVGIFRHSRSPACFHWQKAAVR